MKSCSHSGTSRNSSLRNSSSSSFIFMCFYLWLLTHNFPFFCCWIFPFNILRCRCWRSRCRWSRGTRRQIRDNEWYVLLCTALDSFAIFGAMWFLTIGPVDGIPMIFAELPKWKNCGCFFKKHHCHEYIQFFDIYRGFFSCLHLAVGRHHRRRTSRCPHGVQFGRVKVSLADHMHACSEIYHKLSLLQFYGGCGLHNPLFGRRIECSFVLFFELVKKFGKIPCLAAGAPLLSFSLFLRSVFKFHSVGTSLMRNFDLYFSKRWSFIFSDTCLTLRSLCESYSSNWSQNFLPRVSPETSRFSQVLMAPSHARHKLWYSFHN